MTVYKFQLVIVKVFALLYSKKKKKKLKIWPEKDRIETEIIILEQFHDF